ncbi:hypothetical protein AVEN_222469-1 [Araneus ventricosus]|uniref:Uncharacterized protein n=1 Tax=Araneus ventricosus TaxID=182803 RepID=A0A4Y2SNY3_ARAVE|nr:hypothetical protein AVEN_222469-1 [Araneus ventricosus]
MEKFVSYFVYILMGVILSLVNDSICVPFVSLKKRQILGRTTEFYRCGINEYLGIRYAQHNHLLDRFVSRKHRNFEKVPRRLKAINVPPACLQYTENPYPWYVNGSTDLQERGLPVSEYMDTC